MKKYIKHFSVLLIIFAIVLVLFVVALIKKGPDKEEQGVYERTNTECLTDERVFDYADVLSDDEEKSLRDLIAEKEDEIGCDIVLVTISDPDYAGDTAMMNYADDFYDNYKYGYDAPWGDGALYLDNMLGVGNSYSWFSTSGRVEDTYSTSMINHLIDGVCDKVNADPYDAYVYYINSLSATMSGEDVSMYEAIPWYAIWGVAAVVTFVYVLVCINHNVGKKTTSANTYVAGGAAQFPDRRDVFISKHTTRRTIQSNSGSGGGGGHHTSSGGHSHGGGGGRH